MTVAWSNLFLWKVVLRHERKISQITQLSLRLKQITFARPENKDKDYKYITFKSTRSSASNESLSKVVLSVNIH